MSVILTDCKKSIKVAVSFAAKICVNAETDAVLEPLGKSVVLMIFGSSTSSLFHIKVKVNKTH